VELVGIFQLNGEGRRVRTGGCPSNCGWSSRCDIIRESEGYSRDQGEDAENETEELEVRKKRKLRGKVLYLKAGRIVLEGEE